VIKIKKLIIIPAFNEEHSIASLLRELRDYCSGFDVLVINDGSEDGTSRICRSEGYNVLDLPINLGIGGAVQTGYIYAVQEDYDIVVQMDGDGQHDPRDVPYLVEPILSGNVDMVIGSRFINNEGYQSSHWRRLGIRFYSRLIKGLTGKKIYDPTSGFRVVNREIVNYFAQVYPVDYPEPESIVTLFKLQYRIVELPVRMRKRVGGHSSIKGIKIIYYMMKVTLAILLGKVKYHDEIYEKRKDGVDKDYGSYKITNLTSNHSIKY
jgi:glycosyltransferase involved in cell wall biosynthesis